MKFKKLDENRIKCIISQQEMEENGIELGDFFADQEKTRDFIRDIMAQACEVLNIEPKGSAYSVQMTVMPEGDVSLVISPDPTSGIRDALDQLKRHLTGIQDAMQPGGMLSGLPKPEEMGIRSAENSLDEYLVPETESSDSGKKREKVSDYIKTPLWAVNDSLDDTIRLCSQIPKYQGMTCDLYKMKGQYYLRIKMGMDKRQISGVILAVSEYSKDMFCDNADGMHIVEHGKLIMADCLEALGSL